MKSTDQICKAVQKLSTWLAASDAPSLAAENLQQLPVPEAIVLFGGSTLQGAHTLKTASECFPKARIILAGGYGHTTGLLEEQMKKALKTWPENELSEAVLFEQYIKEQFGLQADWLECKSTNCGNNVTFLLELLKENMPDCRRIAIIQDPSMQRRMKAVFEKEAPNLEIVSIPAMLPVFCLDGSKIRFHSETAGQWSVEKYCQLLCGEIPRLRNDASGYGPKGAGYIAAVDIPDEIEEAWQTLMESSLGTARKADSAYASPET
ncbi:MAG: YdcF family protein [Erysipelotrichaceae bacterium]|nr:YdcF family protein [Erysipelotrichaceae bacterium]